jgi:hypothetical protein
VLVVAMPAVNVTGITGQDGNPAERCVVRAVRTTAHPGLADRRRGRPWDADEWQKWSSRQGLGVSRTPPLKSGLRVGPRKILAGNFLVFSFLVGNLSQLGRLLITSSLATIRATASNFEIGKRIPNIQAACEY